MAIRAGVGHILFRSRNPRFIPEDRPIVMDYDLGPEVTFTFIDVIPGVSRPHEFHGFSQLVDEANTWFNQNPEWKVVNCETVLLFFKGSENELHLAPEDTCFPLDGDFHQSLMGLRLWLLRNPEESPTSTIRKLKYVDFSPRKDNEDPNSRFRKLDAVLERVNREIQSGECDRHMGDIITIETLYYPVSSSDWMVDHKNSLNLFPSRVVSVIRIFYLHSNQIVQNYPIIGVKDFVPKQISGNAFFKMPVFENLSRVLERASAWISSNPALDFKNAQCLEVIMKILGRVDPRVMSHSADSGHFVRIFRVAFTRAADPTMVAAPLSSPLFVSSVIFTPADRNASVQEIKRKIHEWVEGGLQVNAGRMHKPRLLSAETVEIFCKDFSEDEIILETENTFKPNRIGTRNQFLFMAFRLYFDVGLYGKVVERRVSQTMMIPSEYSKSSPTCNLM